MAQSNSNVVGGAAQSGLDVSDGARAAIGQATAALQPHTSDKRVEALVNELNSIADPDGSDASEDELVKAMMSSERIAKSDNASPALRAKAAATSRELQRSYLSKHSAGYGVWESSARDAGWVD